MYCEVKSSGSRPCPVEKKKNKIYSDAGLSLCHLNQPERTNRRSKIKHQNSGEKNYTYKNNRHIAIKKQKEPCLQKHIYVSYI